ncbi:hypothetical protein BE08_37410 [Sorangium cellulosum]|uniref:Uncharacterized protein n=1 Tax=Sorangium cellulosum TaxID=56 RepID=A0A150PBJ5_SORCE|nr:hypothetical protein BE08_37410 [Sorangium cellulosum]
MNLFSKMIRPVTLLGAAAMLGGCVGEASLEGDGEQETQLEAAAADPEPADAIDPDAVEKVETAQQALTRTRLTTWRCWAFNWNPMAGQVTIWWGHTATDALWACNQWVGDCRRGGGSCVRAEKVNDFWVNDW